MFYFPFIPYKVQAIRLDANNHQPKRRTKVSLLVNIQVIQYSFNIKRLGKVASHDIPDNQARKVLSP